MSTQNVHCSRIANKSLGRTQKASRSRLASQTSSSRHTVRVSHQRIASAEVIVSRIPVSTVKCFSVIRQSSVGSRPLQTKQSKSCQIIHSKPPLNSTKKNIFQNELIDQIKKVIIF